MTASASSVDIAMPETWRVLKGARFSAWASGPSRVGASSTGHSASAAPAPAPAWIPTSANSATRAAVAAEIRR